MKPNNRPKAEAPTIGADPANGQLGARPAKPTTLAQASPGVSTLGVIKKRDTLLYVPTSYQPDQKSPLALLLHGAGGNAESGIGLLRPLADQAGLLLLAPASRYQTWDVLRGGYGPDVKLIDQALAQIFATYTVDPSRLAIGGFSDGASYALSLGLTNGALFRHIIAFSPGFMAPSQLTDAPRIFISHGTHDTVLPIEKCSRRLVSQLERANYDVTYREFDGPHTIPAAIAREAMDWYLTTGEPSTAVPAQVV
jgi:predicted esterase